MNGSFRVGSAFIGYHISIEKGIVMVKSILFISLSAVCLAATLSLAVNASMSHRNPSYVSKGCETFSFQCYLTPRG